MGGHKKLAFAIALHRIGASCAVFGSVARNSAALQDTSRARRLRGADAVLLLMMSKGPIIIALRNPRDSSNVGEGASRRETPDEGPKTTSAHEDLAQSQNIVVHTGRISNNPNLVISAIGAGRVEHVHTSIDLTAFPRLKLAEHLSPFRYPGGKAFLAGYLADAISALPVSKEATYVEPFLWRSRCRVGVAGTRESKTNPFERQRHPHLLCLESNS